MQDEVNEKTMALCIKGGKISAQLLKAALTKLLSEIEKKKQQSKKMGGQNRCKRGKQSIKSLQQSGAQLTNIVVTDNNIKSFDRVARKYGIDYSLKKAEKEGKTEYLVFFKAKDVDVMTAAFKEYTGVSLKKEQRQSIRKKLEQAKSVKEAKPRLERIETDILNNFKVLGVKAYPLNGVERLQIMYEMFHQEEERKFEFSYDRILQSGMTTKDFIAPTSFLFKSGKDFQMGDTIGAVSYLNILAPELTDKVLAEFLDMDKKQRLEHELQKQRQRALELEKRIKICDAQMERMRGFLNQSEFDEELVHELIKKIYVGMDNSVEVEFKCSDPYQEVLAIMSEVQNE